MAFSSFVAFALISEIVSNFLTLRSFLSFGNKKKSQGTRSGKEEGGEERRSSVWQKTHKFWVLSGLERGHRVPAVHLQFCCQNLVTRPNWYSTRFGKLPNGQTSICAHQGIDFVNVWVVSWRWRTPRTLIVLSWLSTTLETFMLLETCSTLHGNIAVSLVGHSKCFSCKFPEFHTKFHCNSLLLQVTHFTIR